MTIKEALNLRVPRIRKAVWANPSAYLRLPLFAEGHGPWAELYDEIGQVNGLEIRPGSQRICIAAPSADNENDWERYDGPPSEYEKDPQNFAKSYVEN